MEGHRERVSNIASRVRSFHETKTQWRNYHGTTSTTRRLNLSRDNIVDSSGMNKVIGLNEQRKTILVEPNVSMEELVDASLSHGFVPLVVPEFPAITVGGAFSGTSGESSSFRHSFFDHTVCKIEIVLADGEVVTASKDEKSDLFNAAAGTFGTFGVITLLEVKLQVAKPYVRLVYSATDCMEDTLGALERLADSEKTDYLEGILFGPGNGLIISGQLIDELDTEVPCTRYTRPQDPWFYSRAEQIHKSCQQDFSEIVPIKDYFFRYDRGAFWAGKYAFQYFLLPFTSLTRWVMDGFMKTKVMYHALHKSRIADQYIVQDIGFPYATAGDFIKFVDQKFGFYPLWLCPVKLDPEISIRPRDMSKYFSQDARSRGMMLNVGLWGPGPTQYDRFIQANREVEKKTAELGGLKCFYAQAFYTPDEFWKVYDREWYDGLRAKYKADGLRSIYEKVNVDLSSRTPAKDQGWQEWAYEKFKEQWPVRGVYGVLHLFLGKEYLLSWG